MNYLGLHQTLLEHLTRIVRLDVVGPSLQPNLISRTFRTVGPNGQAYPAGSTVRYPGSTLTLSPPKAKEITDGQFTWESVALLSWAFPNFTYSQLPVGHAANMAARIAQRLTRPFRLTGSDVGAEQLDGSDVWVLLLKLTIQYTAQVDPSLPVGELQPQNFGDLDAPDITDVRIGLWRSPTPLDPNSSVLDMNLDLELDQ